MKPDGQQPERDYRDYLYSSYRSTHFAEVSRGTSGATLRKQVIRHLPVDPRARILELGCGSGELLRLMAASGYVNVSGVDASREQVDLAEHLGTPNVAQGDLFEALAEHEGSLDAVVAVDVLEHLQKPEVMSALRAVHRAIRPGGRLVARVPNAQSPFGGRYRYGDFTHETSFTQHSARQVLLASGFEAVNTFPTDPAVRGPASAARFLMWKLVSASLKAMLAIETGIVRGHIVTQNLVVVADR